MPLDAENKQQISNQIEYICREFIKQINSSNIYYDMKNIDLIFKTYSKLRDKIKTKMRLTPNSNVQIDRHKVAALMLLSFIKTDFIKLKNQNIKKYTEYEEHRNIFVGFMLAKAIIKDFYDQDTKKHHYGVDILDISEDGTMYMIHFKKLIVANKNSLDSIGTNNNSDNIHMVFFISHIFYHLELYFISKTKIKQLEYLINNP